MDAHNGVAADVDAGQHGYLSADPDVFLDDDRVRLAGLATVHRGFGIGEMVPNLTGTEDTIGTDLDPLGGDDGAAVQPGVATDLDQRVGARGDEAVDLGVRPGVDIGVEHHSSWSLDAQPAVPEQTRPDANARVAAIGEGSEPAESAGRRLFHLHSVAITRQRTTLGGDRQISKLTHIYKTV